MSPSAENAISALIRLGVEVSPFPSSAGRFDPLEAILGRSPVVDRERGCGGLDRCGVLVVRGLCGEGPSVGGCFVGTPHAETRSDDSKQERADARGGDERCGAVASDQLAEQVAAGLRASANGLESQESFEVCGDFAGGGVAFEGVGRHGLGDDRGEVLGDVRVEGDKIRDARFHLGEHFAGRGAGERRLEGEGVVDRGTEGEDIAAAAEGAASELLRGGVSERAAELGTGTRA